MSNLNGEIVIDYLNREEAVLFANSIEDDYSSPCPSLKDQLALATIRNTPIRLVVLRKNGNIMGSLLCQLHSSRHDHPPIYRGFGEDLYDYRLLEVKDGGVFLRLIDALQYDAKVNNASLLNLKGLIISNYEPTEPFLFRHETCVFDATQAEQGWSWLTKKKSLRRHINKAKRHKDYRVEHTIGNITPEALAMMADLHRERFDFDDMDSAFNMPTRIVEYAACQKNRLMTSVFFDNQLVCCHYGMIFGRTLLWHTPVINIKYLNYSPLEILLAVTAEWCSKNNIMQLDYGQGLEVYKYRFSNDRRISWQFVRPCSFLGLPAYIRELLFHYRGMGAFSVINNARKLAQAACYSVVPFLRAVRKQVLWYTALAGRAESSFLPSTVQFADIQAFAEFVDFCRSHSFAVKRLYYDRFCAGDNFFVLFGEGAGILSWGWGTRSREFYVGEIQRVLRVDTDILLYDFNTSSSFRNQGYYTLLLKKILTYYAAESISIFASSDNKASLAGIQRSGFHYSRKFHMFC